MNPETVKRNFVTVNEVIKQLRAENADLKQQVHNVQTQLAQNTNELNKLRQMLAPMLARLGGGPTSGN